MSVSLGASAADFAQALVALFVIVNPTGAIPAFIAMTESDDAIRRSRAARTAAITCTVILLAVAIAGHSLLWIFSISIAAFQISGSVILFAIAYEMLHVRLTRMKSTQEEMDQAIDREQVAVTPVGTPLLAGPGAITTVLVLRGQLARGWGGFLVLVATILLVGAITWVTLALATRIRDRMGPIALGVMMRVEGLLLAAIAVQMLIDGLHGAF